MKNKKTVQVVELDIVGNWSEVCNDRRRLVRGLKKNGFEVRSERTDMFNVMVFGEVFFRIRQCNGQQTLTFTSAKHGNNFKFTTNGMYFFNVDVYRRNQY